ncbi:MAG: helix-turn-helix transcriptional regulator [Novosphingobium sp.]|nr:helix-turn-helix transcriptional regulator [Novosphingobium sp.]
MNQGNTLDPIQAQDGSLNGPGSDAVVLALYRTVRDTHPWRQVLGLLVRFFGLSSAAAIRSGGTGWLVRAGAGDALLSRECDWAVAGSAHGTDGKERHHVLTAALAMPDGAAASLHLHRGRNDPAFTDEEEEQLERFLPHIAGALNIAGKIARRDAKRLLYETTLDHARIGAIFLNDAGEMLNANGVALSLLAEEDGLRLVDGKLAGCREADTAVIAGLLEKAREEQEQVFAATLSRPPGKRDLPIMARAMPEAARVEGNGHPTVTMFVRDAFSRTTMKTEELSQFFGFTAAEARLSIELANGLSLNEAAAALGIRRNTARAYLRSIFSKTGVGRQTELMRLLII